MNASHRKQSGASASRSLSQRTGAVDATARTGHYLDEVSGKFAHCVKLEEAGGFAIDSVDLLGRQFESRQLGRSLGQHGLRDATTSCEIARRRGGRSRYGMRFAG